MMDVEREEGEMSEDDDMIVDDKPTLARENECTVLYKADKSGLVVKKLEKIDAFKLEERAKRFGLNLCGNRTVTQKQIDELYSNCGIESGNERHFRFDALHLYGVEGLSTKEIFEYLEDYKPVSLEWIDDNSCNIVCKDHISAALALLVHSREIQNEELKKINEGSHHWREGMPHPKNDSIIMRFATNSDKKIGKKRSDLEALRDGERKRKIESDSKNPWGDLCKSWGVYDHQEIFQRKLPKTDYEEELEGSSDMVQVKNKRLAMRLGKRSQDTVNNEDSNSDSEWKKKSKAPRMRMHADDEESKKKKNINVEQTAEARVTETYAPLSIEVINTKITYTPRDSSVLSEKFKSHGKPHTQTSSRHNVRSRLGAKIQPRTEYSSDDESTSENSDDNEQIMSRVQKIDNSGSKSTVWARLEEKQQDKRDLRLIIKNRHKNTDDLRSRLGKLKQSNLRIEIDNDVLT